MLRRTLIRAGAALAFATSLWLAVAGQIQAGQAKATSTAPKYKVGDMAPDFTLKDQNGKQVSLHDFRGKQSVVLAFYVFAFTGG